MGNITALNRYQAGTKIDSLAYTYNTGTNQLQSVNDQTTNDAGLVHGTTTYSWDGNGNLLSNSNINTAQNKSFTYNLLDLPQAVTVAGGTLTYIYDATGNKLRKVSVISGVTKTTDYISGIEYDGATTDTLNFIQTEESKAAKFGAIYDYTYYLGDNLGNTRITFGTKTNVVVTYQKDDYYPFGMEIIRSAGNPKNEYLYNKKELQEETQEYDYGARYYDPVIARWNTIDPLAEISRRWSPYNYVENNPIRFTDPDGMTSAEDQALYDWGHQKGLEAAEESLEGTAHYSANISSAGTTAIVAKAANAALAFAGGGGDPKKKKGDKKVKAASNSASKGPDKDDVVRFFQGLATAITPFDPLVGSGSNENETEATTEVIEDVEETSIFTLDASARGFAAERELGGNLPNNFPIIDQFEPGFVASIKSIDVLASSYQKGNALLNTMKSYIRNLASFRTGRAGGITVNPSDYNDKILKVAIQAGKATPAQLEQIGEAIRYGTANNIHVTIYYLK